MDGGFGGRSRACSYVWAMVAIAVVLTLGQAGAESVRDMFPVGNIAGHAPRVAHPCRTIPELFGSFEYDGRLWMPTGRFARSYQVELVPLGLELNGRGLYALANTSAPSAVLFVRSGRDPSRFAIYR